MSSRDLFAKHRPNIKLATRFDADGKEIQVEVREDEEQNEKQQEIFDILVAAGYFRARIKGLSAFDKVVGGMVWCIEACDYDVDIDLLFNENLTIGQKIFLTEKIVAVLPKMSCPFQIEPHQIQGLDFINIFPVIQWLVKRSVENRTEKAEKLKIFAVSQFHNNFSLNSDQIIKNKNLKVLQNIKKIEDLFCPRRQFKRKEIATEDEKTRVRITLLEYGNKDILSNILKKTDTNVKQPSEENIEEGQMDETNLEQLFNNLSIANEDEYFDYVELSEAEKNAIKKNMNELKSEMSIDSKKLSEHNKINALLSTKLSLEKKLAKIKEKNEDLQNDLETNRKKYETLLESQTQIENEIEELNKKEIESDKSVLEAVQNLVIKNEEMKQKETEFKEECKKELVNLQNQIKESEEYSPDNDIQESQQELAQETKRLQGLRLQLAKQNRAIVTIQRQLDNIPDRTELAQYQRRFLELYNQVSAKHRETKQFYTLFNTLDDTKLYLSKELSLLNSIYENYNEAMTSMYAKDQFLKQFESLSEGIKQMKIKLKSKCDDEKAKRDGLNAQLLCLVEQQRKLATAIKQLKIECKRNDELLLEMKAIQSKG